MKRNKLPEYRAWKNMKTRCLNPNYSEYNNYGGRGITIHPDWMKYFTVFFQDVGRRPSPKHSLERKDNNKGYIPGNVVWATRLEQNQNQSSNVLLTFGGVTKCAAEWARDLDADPTAVLHRINQLGWPVEKAVTQPIRRRRIH